MPGARFAAGVLVLMMVCEHFAFWGHGVSPRVETNRTHAHNVSPAPVVGGSCRLFLQARRSMLRSLKPSRIDSS